MKYLKKFNEELTHFEYVKELKDLLIDLEHYGFYVEIMKTRAMNLDQKFVADKKNIISGNFLYNPYNVFNCYMITIYNKEEESYKLFDINEILEILKFLESYSKDILNLKLEYLAIKDIHSNYCKSIDDIPPGVYYKIYLYFKIP